MAPTQRLEDEVAKRLRAIQVEFDISGNRALGELCGNASASSVNNWLNGYNLPRVPEMIALAGHTGISLDWLYRGTLTVMDAKLAVRLARRIESQARQSA